MISLTDCKQTAYCFIFDVLNLFSFKNKYLPLFHFKFNLNFQN